MNRREMILRTGAAALGLRLAGFPNISRAEKTQGKKVLFFSKSSGYEHPMIKRKDGQPSPAEKILAELGPKHGIDFTFSKDGSLFNPDYLALCSRRFAASFTEFEPVLHDLSHGSPVIEPVECIFAGPRLPSPRAIPCLPHRTSCLVAWNTDLHLRR